MVVPDLIQHGRVMIPLSACNLASTQIAQLGSASAGR